MTSGQPSSADVLGSRARVQSLRAHNFHALALDVPYPTVPMQTARVVICVTASFPPSTLQSLLIGMAPGQACNQIVSTKCFAQ